MMDWVFRNSFRVVILKSMLLLAVLLVFGLSFFWVLYGFADVPSSKKYELETRFFMVLALPYLIFLFRWLCGSRTTYTFTDAGIVVQNDLLGKPDKAIKYDRVSRIETVRSFRDKIIGTSTLRFWHDVCGDVSVIDASLVLKKELAEELCRKLNDYIFGNGAKDSEERYRGC